MPSRIELAENLWLMYICLQNSDYKAIDFNAVGDITNLKAPAARMRFTRLRRAIEDGTLIDTHGKQFQGSADKIAEAQKKRKKPLSEELDCDGDEEDSFRIRPRKKTARSPSCESKVGGCPMPKLCEPEIRPSSKSPADVVESELIQTSELKAAEATPTERSSSHAAPDTPCVHSISTFFHEDEVAGNAHNSVAICIPMAPEDQQEKQT